MRLNKFLAEAGLGARRKVEELIKNGRVQVNNKEVTNLATGVDPEKDSVKVDGQTLSIEKKVYILLNKPRGYVTTVDDELGRKTVLNLVKVKERIFPVGRLDMNSRGLLLLTNDGDMAAKLLHPRHKIPKIYIVKANKLLNEKQLKSFEQGIEIEGKKTAPAKIRIHTRVRPTDPRLSYEVTLSEGRKRQIRYMFEALGAKVLDLKRTKIGSLRLDNLKEGHWRYVTDKELKALAKTPKA